MARLYITPEDCRRDNDCSVLLVDESLYRSPLRRPGVPDTVPKPFSLLSVRESRDGGPQYGTECQGTAGIEVPPHRLSPTFLSSSKVLLM